MKKFNKKGKLDLDSLPTLLLTFAFISVIGFAIFLVLAGLETAIPDSDGNVSTTEVGVLAVGNMTTSVTNVISFAPTWGVVLGVSVLIGIVVAAFAFGRGKFNL